MRVYVNLPVADLDRSRRFFAALGFGFDERFSDATAIAMKLGDDSAAMLLSHEKFQTFTPRRLADARQTTEVLTALQLESREAVDAMVARALAAGGAAVREPEGHGFMYGQAFADPDGHIREPFWMAATASGMTAGARA